MKSKESLSGGYLKEGIENLDTRYWIIVQTSIRLPASSIQYPINYFSPEFTKFHLQNCTFKQ